MPPIPGSLPDDPDFIKWMTDGGGRGGGGQGIGGGGGFSGPFIPTYSGGGEAQGWVGQPQQEPWSPFIRRRPMSAPLMRGRGATQAFGGGGPGAMVPAGGRMAAPMWGQGGKAPWAPAPPATGPVFGDNPGATIGSLLQNALTGGQAYGQGYGGLFGINPPEAIMQGIRQQAVADAGARERAARLGLQSRGDIDPSTYGFQALQSQLQGQGQTAQAMSQADLALRQQQQENYWRALMAMLGEYGQNQRTYIGTEAQRAGPGFDWGGLAGGIRALGGLGSMFGKRVPQNYVPPEFYGG